MRFAAPSRTITQSGAGETMVLEGTCQDEHGKAPGWLRKQ
jgi:hypothetical protein